MIRVKHKLHVMRHIAGVVAFIILWIGPVAAQKSSGPANGTLIIDGGGATEAIVRRFVELAGGPQARIVVIATAPSSIRFGPDNVILDPDWPRDRNEWRLYQILWLQEIRAASRTHTSERERIPR